MSGSPKYASVQLSGERRRQLEQERLRRAEERVRRAEERHRRLDERYRGRLAERAAALEHRRDEALARLQETARRIEQQPGISPEQRTAIRARVDQVGATLTADGSRTATAQLRSVERELAIELGRSADDAAAYERAADVAAVEALLQAEEDRLWLDADGARQVDVMVRSVRQSQHDPHRFHKVHAELVERAERHLRAVDDNRKALDAVERESALAIEAFDAVLAEAADAQAVLPGQERAEATRQRLVADLAAGLVPSAQRGTVALTAAVAELEISIEEVLDAMYQTELIVEAAADALPSVGFQVLGDTVVQTGSSVAFQVARADGTVFNFNVELVAEGARVTYEGHADDYVLARTTEGPVAVCDLTENLIERFHEQLAAHDVETGELQWEGKPSRPDLRTAQRVAGDIGKTHGQD